MWALVRAGSALAIGIGIATWQFARLLVWVARLGVGRFWEGGKAAYRAGWAVVLGLSGLFALALVLPLLLQLLMPGAWLPAGLRDVLAGWQLLLATVVLAAVGGFGVPSALLDLGTRVRQRRILLGKVPPPPLPAEPDPRRAGTGMRGRDIVILLDGTSNRADRVDAEGREAVTNIVKLHRMLVCDEGQVTWYRAGVGSDTSSTAEEAQRSRRVLEVVGQDFGARIYALAGTLVRAVESATGKGTAEAVALAYGEIARLWQPGDRIHILGFSRGAYAARCTAGVISRFGLLRPEHARYAADVVALYRAPLPEGMARPTPLPAAMVWPAGEARVRLLGLFDTVASLGAPLWGDWHRLWTHWDSPAGLNTDPSPICDLVCHAVSMDERRSQFLPTLLTLPEGEQGLSGTVLEQVWFRGSHGDIGGGYAETGLSDIALGWMLERAEAAGLRLRPGAAATLAPEPLALPHDELVRQRHWRLFGSWPRWHPVPGHEVPGCPGLLHPSVLERAEAVERELGRPDLAVLGEARGPVRILVEAQHEWHRSGVALEGKGAVTRVTWLGGSWRDATCAPCGPAGQAPQGLDLARRVFGWRRRLPRAPWMALVVTLAHPQAWPLRERGFGQLLKRLLLRDPWELRRQLAPIGLDLKAPGDSVYLRSDAPAGLLHAFANDLWQTARNNTGGVMLELARIPAGEVPPGAPVWALERGRLAAGREGWRWRRMGEGLAWPPPSRRERAHPPRREGPG